MVTFTSPDGRWQDHVRVAPFGTTNQEIAVFSGRPIQQFLIDGEHAMNLLAEKWKCKPEEIAHDLPQEITTPEQELEFMWFYRGLGFAAVPVGCEQPGMSYKTFWADIRIEGGSLFPYWKNVIHGVRFDAQREYSQAAINRIMSPAGSRIATGYDIWRAGGHDKVVVVEIWANHAHTFRFCEGEFREDGFHMRRLTGDSVRCVIPYQPDAKRALDIVAEEKAKAALKILRDTSFPEDHDVAVIRDYDRSLLRDVDPLPSSLPGYRYQIFWVSGNGLTALLARIPSSGTIRCPEEFRGQLIGSKGVKINEIAKKHGFRQLKVI